MDVRRTILRAGILPQNYQQIEYVVADGSPYIQTDYVPCIGDEFRIRFLSSETANMEGLISAGNDTYQLILLKYGEEQYNFYYKYFASGVAVELRWGLYNDVWHDITINSNGVATSGNMSGTSAPENELDGSLSTLWVLRRRNSNYPWYGSLGSLKITNNGVVKMNLIPCIRKKDNIVGMYDVVGRRFYGSSGARPFTAGPIVH